MEFRESDPHLFQRLKNVQVTYLSEESGVKTCTILLAVFLSLTNVLVILVTASFVIDRNLIILPSNPPAMKVRHSEPSAGRFTTHRKGLYLVQSRASFHCEFPVDQSVHQVQISGHREAFKDNFTLTEGSREKRRNVFCHQSLVLVFFELLPGENISVDFRANATGDLLVFKIAEL